MDQALFIFLSTDLFREGDSSLPLVGAPTSGGELSPSQNRSVGKKMNQA